MDVGVTGVSELVIFKAPTLELLGLEAGPLRLGFYEVSTPEISVKHLCQGLRLERELLVSQTRPETKHRSSTRSFMYLGSKLQGKIRTRH